MSSLKYLPTEERRRSTRLDRGVALIVKGADVFKVPYQEFALTEAINSHGCRYQTKHKVAPGEVVQLDVVHTEDGHPGRSAQARVKWVSQPERGNQASYFEVAVELDAPGNVWGIANPPGDWSTKPVESGAPGNVWGAANAPKESPAAERPKPIDRPNPAPGGPSSIPLVAAPEAAAPAAPPKQPAPSAPNIDSPALAQFMTQFLDGLSTHTQVKATDAAVLAVRQERDRWLADLRTELQAELPKIVERVVASAKTDLISEAKQAKEAQESVRASYENWTKAIRAEMDEINARFHAQRNETAGHLETAAASTIERAQRSLEDSRRQELENSVSELRSQITPLLEEVKTVTEGVKAAQEELKTGLLTASNAFQQFARHEHERVTAEVQNTVARLRQEFEDHLGGRAGAVRGELERQSAESVERAKEALLRLSQATETDTKQRFEGFMASALAEWNALQEKTREYAGKMENSSRRQLQFITELLNKFAAPDQPNVDDSAPPAPKP